MRTLASVFAVATVVFGMTVQGTHPLSQQAEVTALGVLNDSAWAHPIRTKAQSLPCSEANPAFSVSADNLLNEPDGNQYVVRLLSVKPMQQAIAQIVELDEKLGKRYKFKVGFTNIEESKFRDEWLNQPDLIVIAVVDKDPGARRPNFFETVVDKSRKVMEQLPDAACAAIRTTNGQANLSFETVSFDENGRLSAIWFCFLREIGGKRIIGRENEKLDFRLVANQRVFETSFVVSPSDLSDEPKIFVPPTFDDPKADQ